MSYCRRRRGYWGGALGGLGGRQELGGGWGTGETLHGI